MVGNSGRANKAVAPNSPKEIEKAKGIVLAYEEAQRNGLSVVSVGTKMVDPPIVKRALKQSLLQKILVC